MASPLIVYSDLTALASEGGYANTPALTELSAVFLLSACLVMQQRKLWQDSLLPISDSEWESILEMLEKAESDLMNNWQVGSIIPSVATVTPENCLKMDGGAYPVDDYPELANIVPNAWIVGINIVLPDMSESGVFGANTDANIGVFRGENSVQLTVGEMPTHNHTQNPHSHTYTQGIGTPTGAGAVVAGASIVVPTPSVTGLATATNNPEGGDGSHNNIQRSLQMNYFIVAR